MDIPVALIIFNRPVLTRQVFGEIARQKPSKLFVIADGPRGEVESKQCQEARKVIESANWDCDIATNYSEVNLGCKRRVSSGLDWVFEHCEEAIILEDDCVPHPSFFRYATELLEKYRSDSRIMIISGDNFQPGTSQVPSSYYFSRYPHIWGWATWRRAWQFYDVNISAWPSLRDTSWLLDFLNCEASAQYWNRKFEGVYTNNIDTWDYQLVFACWLNKALSIVPDTNLVYNIGFGEGATHTKDSKRRFVNLAANEMQFPLSHPSAVERDSIADDFTAREIFGINGSTMKRAPMHQLVSKFLRRARRKLLAA